MNQRLLLLMGTMLVASPAKAADLAINVGALEVVVLPRTHGGLYPNLGLSVAMPTQLLTLIGALSVEWSPDQERGGLVGVLTADFGVGQGWGFDLNLAAIHDQPGWNFSQSMFFVGGGPGVSWFFDKWTVSPYVNLFFSLDGSGWSAVPGINVARML